MKKRVVITGAAIAAIAVVVIIAVRFVAAPSYGATGDVVYSFVIPRDSQTGPYRMSQGLDFDGTYLLYLDGFADENITPRIFKLTTAGEIHEHMNAPESTSTG
jgi:hypothetical protein